MNAALGLRGYAAVTPRQQHSSKVVCRPSRRIVVAPRAVADTTTSVAKKKENLLQAIEGSPVTVRAGDLMLEFTMALRGLLADEGAVRDKELALSLVNGNFDKLLVTTSYANSDGTVDLGDFSFGKFGPSNLKVKVTRVNLVMGQAQPDEFTTYNHFVVADGAHAGLAGILTVPGRYILVEEEDGNKIQEKQFLGVEIQPKSGTNTQAWLDLLKGANPGISDDGVAKVMFETPEKGTRALLYVDPDMQISIDHRGFIAVAVRRAS